MLYGLYVLSLTIAPNFSTTRHMRNSIFKYSRELPHICRVLYPYFSVNYMFRFKQVCSNRDKYSIGILKKLKKETKMICKYSHYITNKPIKMLSYEYCNIC